MAQFGLEDWQDLEEDDWPLLLAGNGASRAVSDAFAYDSLLAAANLDPDDVELFDHLGTSNFEEVLRSLDFARIVHEQLGGDPADVQDRREVVRHALVETVNNHHVDWLDVAGPRLTAIKQALREFHSVFTTSYDLVFYWAMNHNGAHGFADFFWHLPDNYFDPDDSDLIPNRTHVYWLHGGLHLYRTADDGTAKRVHLVGAALLDQFAAGGLLPLYVAEGEPEQKRRSIRRSDYLTFCLERFEQDDRPLVVFGQSLGPSDQHLVDAIKQVPDRDLAYAIYPTTQLAVNGVRAHIEELLDRDDITFFDSTTHPLGDPALHVP
jgi:hypothetical protein